LFQIQAFIQSCDVFSGHEMANQKFDTCALAPTHGYPSRASYATRSYRWLMTAWHRLECMPNPTWTTCKRTGVQSDGGLWPVDIVVAQSACLHAPHNQFSGHEQSCIMTPIPRKELKLSEFSVTILSWTADSGSFNKMSPAALRRARLY
jgi:hypothetical protein